MREMGGNVRLDDAHKVGLPITKELAKEGEAAIKLSPE